LIAKERGGALRRRFVPTVEENSKKLGRGVEISFLPNYIDMGRFGVCRAAFRVARVPPIRFAKAGLKQYIARFVTARRFPTSINGAVGP